MTNKVDARIDGCPSGMMVAKRRARRGERSPLDLHIIQDRSNRLSRTITRFRRRAGAGTNASDVGRLLFYMPTADRPSTKAVQATAPRHGINPGQLDTLGNRRKR
jgi:hypothetical protein